MFCFLYKEKKCRISLCRIIREKIRKSVTSYPFFPSTVLCAAKTNYRSQTMAARIINSNHVVVFSWVNCPYCKKAKKLLLQEAVSAGDMKVVELDTLGAQGDEIQGEIIKNFNHETVPAIFIGQQFIGGFTELAAKAKGGELVKLLQPGQGKF